MALDILLQILNGLNHIHIFIPFFSMSIGVRSFHAQMDIHPSTLLWMTVIPLCLPFLRTLHWSDLTELLLILENVQPLKLIRLTIQQFMRICTISIQHTHHHYHSRFPGVITMTILDNTQVSRMLMHSSFRDTLAQEGGFFETTFTKTRYHVSQHVKSTTRGAGDG
jgi:hypothetical protein